MTPTQQSGLPKSQHSSNDDTSTPLLADERAEVHSESAAKTRKQQVNTVDEQFGPSRYDWQQSSSANSLSYQHGLRCGESLSNNSTREKREARKMKQEAAKYLSIRSIGILLFILASCFCVYKIILLSENGDSTSEDYIYTTELKLVSAVCRHGDRSPSEDLPPGDMHASRINYFWPNGMANLTDAGRIRQYRLGHALRRRYSGKLNYSLPDATKVLTFSSGFYRCVDSTRQTLRGFYSLDQSKAAGLAMVRDYNANCYYPIKPSDSKSQELDTHCSGRQISKGYGSPDEWSKVPIDLHSVPVLNWEYLSECKWRKNEGLSPIDSDLLQSKAVRELDGILELKEELLRQYNISFVRSTIDHWSNILTEVRVEHTNETMMYTDHFARWIDKRISLAKNSSLALKYKGRRLASIEDKLPTLFDVFEILSLYVARDRIPEGLASKIQLGPILTSLVDSQQVALGAGDNAQVAEQLHQPKLVDLEKSKMYHGKKMVLYFTHDTILQLLMFRLHLIKEDLSASYAERFVRHYEDEMYKQYLSGLRMAEFGTSLVFELYEMRQVGKDVANFTASNGTELLKSFAFVQAVFYFEEDPLIAPIEFNHLHLGSVCRKLFKLKFPDSDVDQLFYDNDFTKRKEFSHKLSCPFELFRNLTMQDYAIESHELASLCEWPK